MTEVARDEGESDTFSIPGTKQCGCRRWTFKSCRCLTARESRDALVDEVYIRCEERMDLVARDGQQVSTDVELGEAAAEYIDGLPKRLERNEADSAR